MSRPQPKFSKYDFVYHNGMLVCILESRWNEDLQLHAYYISYTQGTDMDALLKPLQMGGGSSCWWVEDDLKPISDPMMALRAAWSREVITATEAEKERRIHQQRADNHLTSLRVMARALGQTIREEES